MDDPPFSIISCSICGKIISRINMTNPYYKLVDDFTFTRITMSRHVETKHTPNLTKSKTAKSTHMPQNPPLIHQSILKRAQKIAAGNIIKNPDGSFDIPSVRNPKKSYHVTATSCQCQGFMIWRNRRPDTAPTCSHVEAVKLYNSAQSKSDHTPNHTPNPTS